MKRSDNVIFVTGIGTGVGKSVATGAIAREMLKGGVDVITVKMVQTGNDGFSEDIDLHRKMMGVSFPEDAQGLTAPQIFKYPSSALLAAELEGRRVDLAAIRKAVGACAKAHDVVLVESAGGLFVPLTRSKLTVDFAAEEGWPAILVANGALGSINHTLMSIEAMKARAMRILGVVYSWSPDVPPEIDADTPATIARYLKRWKIPAPVVRLPRQDVG